MNADAKTVISVGAEPSPGARPEGRRVCVGGEEEQVAGVGVSAQVGAWWSVWLCEGGPALAFSDMCPWSTPYSSTRSYLPPR